MNKFKRIKFFKTVEVDGIIEKDLVHNYWNLFHMSRPVNYYLMTRSFIGRPDLLSIFLYGNIKYWWLLLKVNNIDDIWNDMKVGEPIIVPDINDYEDWLLKVVTQQRNESGV
jgi:hypothetical protein